MIKIQLLSIADRPSNQSSQSSSSDFLKNFLLVFVFYFALVFVMTATWSTFSAGTIARSKMNRPLIERASDKVFGLKERSLALNFLANERSLSFKQSLDFQNSGLTHLLAVSGGQISPVVGFFTVVIGSVTLFFFRRKISLQNLFALQNRFAFLTGFGFAYVLAILFGATGALIRVVFLSYFARFPMILSAILFLVRRTDVRSPETWTRSVAVIILAFWIGNPFGDLSFLLSALGAAVAGLVAQNLCILLPRSFSRSWIIDIFFHYIVLCAVTSVCVTLFLMPFLPVSLVATTGANLIAGPLVQFVLTPLTLVLLVLPSGFPFIEKLPEIFDTALGFLSVLAQSFAKIAQQSSTQLLKNPFGAVSTLKSDVGIFYLQFCVCALWSFSDTLSLRFLRKLQLERRAQLSDEESV